MSIEARIQQFRKMAEADPENELGHFSLGKALMENSQHADAVGPLTRALQLNPTMSKAYQLLGESYAKSGNRAKAVETLTRGVTAADEQGDRMPRDAMAQLLRDLGADVPAFKQSERTVDATGGAAQDGFKCSRCASPHGRLERRPFKGPLGEKVHAHVCATCWREWIGMGTKVINEMGLVMSSKMGQDTYDQYMIEFLQLEEI